MQLFLQAAEKDQFAALSQDVREGWEVVDETSTAFERPEELKMRVLMLDTTDPGMKMFIEKAQQVKDATDAHAVLKVMGDVPPSVLFTIFFTIGTRVMSDIILSALSHVKTDEELEGVAHLTEIRHMLLESNAEVSAPL